MARLLAIQIRRLFLGPPESYDILIEEEVVGGETSSGPPDGSWDGKPA